MKKRDKLLHKYCKAKEKDSLHIQAIYEEYKVTRNSITRMKRESKIDYYRTYFEVNKTKASSIWKGIRSIVNIQNSSKKDIKLLNDKGKNISDPKKITELFNKYFVNIGPNIDSKIPKAHKHLREYMRTIKVNKTFFLTATTPQEIYDIISTFDIKKSLGPNIRPVYILKFSLESFQTYANSLRLYQSSKNKIFEKVINKRMYDFIDKNQLIYERQFGFRDKHSTNHALIILLKLLNFKLTTVTMWEVYL